MSNQAMARSYQEEELPGYWSTLLGNPVWIRNPPGTPRPREECTPFTFTLATLPPLTEGQEYTGEGGRYVFTDAEGNQRFGYKHEPDYKGQERFLKAVARKPRKSKKSPTEQCLAAFLRVKFANRGR